MARMSWALIIGLLLAVAGTTRAAEPPLAGSWKLTVLDQGKQPTLWIVKLENKDGKWGGTVLATGEEVPETTLGDVVVTPERFSFTLRVGKGGSSGYTFEAKVPAEPSPVIRGSMQVNDLFPARLEATKLEALDSYQVNKELVAGNPSEEKLIYAVLGLLLEAEEKKATPEEVRGWADKAFRAAESFGRRWQLETARRLSAALATIPKQADLAVTYGRRAERLLDPKDNPTTQYAVLTTLSSALTKAGKPEEAAEVTARMDKIDVSVKPLTGLGRKGSSTRGVLVELFTGVTCPPCVAADLAFDGLLKSYKPGEVIFLQYHVHVPGLDPLTTNAGMERYGKYYEDVVQGTPATLVNGRPVEGGGGSFDDAPALYRKYVSTVSPLLEEPAGARLSATATRTGDKISIAVNVDDVAKPGENLKLRTALVEDEIRYTGSNQIRAHHRVVRAMPSGVKGDVLRAKDGKFLYQVDLADLRKKLKSEIDEAADRPVMGLDRVMEMKNLRVVAFVQNDMTREVVQAIEADVR